MPAYLHELVRQRFAEYLASRQVAASPARESLLIRDGCYCGRKFQASSCSLVWFVEEKQIKVYGPDGTLWLSSSVDEFVQPTTIRRAA
jgi:hypothetical protein